MADLAGTGAAAAVDLPADHDAGADPQPAVDERQGVDIPPRAEHGLGQGHRGHVVVHRVTGIPSRVLQHLADGNVRASRGRAPKRRPLVRVPPGPRRRSPSPPDAPLSTSDSAITAPTSRTAVSSTCSGGSPGRCEATRRLSAARPGGSQRRRGSVSTPICTPAAQRADGMSRIRVGGRPAPGWEFGSRPSSATRPWFSISVIKLVTVVVDKPVRPAMRTLETGPRRNRVSSRARRLGFDVADAMTGQGRGGVPSCGIMISASKRPIPGQWIIISRPN